MTEKTVQRKWVQVQTNWEFKLSEFKIAGFHSSFHKKIPQNPCDITALSPNISMLILLNGPYIFDMILVGRLIICFSIKIIYVW